MSTVLQTGKGGIGLGGRGAVTVFHTGEASPQTTTTGTDTTPVVTETYVARILIPHNALITGLSLLNGSAVAGNVTAILYDWNGAPIVTSASTPQSGTAAFA